MDSVLKEEGKILFFAEVGNVQLEEEDTIIFDADTGYIKSLEDLATLSIISDNEPVVHEVKKTEELPKAPDGGYGWVICCGVFMNHMVYGALARSEGLFFLQFQSMFGTTAQLAAWPGSLMSTLNLFMGPLCGAVVSRFSVRTAFIIGTTLAFTGMFLNAFAPNVYFLFLSHTVFGGLGRGLMSGILLLNLYFDKHRSLATGLGMSGVGIGSLWVVPLVQYLFDEYGFTGAFMILSGLCLQGYVIGMVFRPLRTHYRFLTAKRMRKNKQNESSEDSNSDTSSVSSSSSESSSQNLSQRKGNRDKLFVIHEKGEPSENMRPVENEPLLEEPEKYSGEVAESLSERNMQEMKEESHTRDISSVTDAEPIVLESQRKDITEIEKPQGEEIEIASKTKREEIAETKELLVEETETLVLDESDNLNTNEQADKTNTNKTKIPHIAREKKSKRRHESKRKNSNFFRSSLKICFPVEFKTQGEANSARTFHWDLIKHAPFMVYCTANFLFNLAFKIAFMFLPAIAMSKGLTKQEAAMLITIAGALDTLGRVVVGFIMDLKPLRPIRPYIFNFLLFGIACSSLLMPSLTSFATFGVVCGIYGFFTGAFIPQKMVVLVDILGREKMPSSLGIQKVFQGFGVLVGAPLAGALRDILGSYDSSFYLGGACMAGSSLLMMFSMIMLRIKNRKSQT